MGRLCADPESKTLPSGDAVTDLRLAINRAWKDGKTGEKREETCFIDAVCYGSRAPALAEYFHKGSRILVEGRLKLDEWEKDGQKRSKHRVLIESWQFIDSKQESERGSYERPASTRAPAASESPAEDKLPF
jgi:single-strand DNA-binding protein